MASFEMTRTDMLGQHHGQDNQVHFFFFKGPCSFQAFCENKVVNVMKIKPSIYRVNTSITFTVQ